MRKLFSTIMVSLALIALINPLAAECESVNPGPGMSEQGTCVGYFITGGINDPREREYYCDITLPPNDCWKELNWY